MNQCLDRTCFAPIGVAVIALVLGCCKSYGADSVRYEAVDATAFKPELVYDTTRAAAPLRAQDRVVIRDGHFYTVGDPATANRGKRIRFFGVSLALSANFPSDDDGEALAQRLAALGVNIVRLHAIDQPAQHDPAGPVGVLVDAVRPQLDPQAIQTLSRFIAQLGRHGIYVDLNLFANHAFPATRRGEHIPAQSKPLPIFDADMMAWQETYARTLLSALRLQGSPDLALVEINNESTLIDAWQEDTLPTLVTGRFRTELCEQWAAYRAYLHLHAMPLPLSRSGLSDNDARAAARFFVELDERYIDRMVAVVKNVLGDDVPISGTQIIHSGRWNHGGFANFDINRAATFTDAHFYVDHYFFPHRQWDWTDWRISNGWLGDSPIETLLNSAFARSARRPFVISEFNQAWPNEQGSDLLPTVTQFAVSQDWDGLILYDYAHDRDWSAATPSDFSLRGDLTKLIQFAQCSAYFRSLPPDTSLAQLTITLPRDDRIIAAANRIAGNLAPYLWKHFGVESALAMHRQVSIANGTTAGRQTAAAGRTSSYFAYDGTLRQFTFGSAYAAGVSGYLEAGQLVKSSVLGVTLSPDNRDFATVFLTSLDGKPLVDSTRLLLTIPGATMGTGAAGSQRLQPVDSLGAWQTIAPEHGGAPSASLYQVPGPTQMERIAATIRVETAARHATVIALDMRGEPLRSIDISTVDGSLIFDVNRAEQSFSATYVISIRR
ncbi:conserved hypothetical protein [Paraburkholderia piptadeniae]|uniref:Glycoside hydrolase family 5 domain-containing protein n=1 Tax=Paraburkholderia piptadeniae TaxID=1701573 RepID=A0A1N7SL34_9BURK|nr:hypothetical protein [Paraburkholderia piptadeniae]SIT48042.1 conserved hypothetical protein [Paraburkholderia piptadeniae]